MNLQDWSALAQVVSGIAVVVTLIVLIAQVRANTRALDDARKLALAQAYQQRSAALQETFLAVSNSDELSEIQSRLTRSGRYDAMSDEELVAAFAALTPRQQARWRNYLNAQRARLDNLVFQHEQRFISADYYESALKPALRLYARLWQVAGLPYDLMMRPGFAAAVRDALKDVNE